VVAAAVNAAPAAATQGAEAAWQRVSVLRPRLREHLRVHVHRYRGEPWYVVEDPLANRCHRFDSTAWSLVRLLDGERNVGTAAARLGLADHVAGRAEVLTLMARLHAVDLLAAGLPPSTEALLERLHKAARSRLQRGMMSPLSVRVPLLDPDRLLARARGLARLMFNVPGLVAWLLAVCAGALLAAEHWDELVLHFETRALDPRNVAMLWAIYPLVKLLHELGHGLAVKRWGGSVHEMGVMLLVFTPVPYVDATASTAFSSKHRRMVVAGAGIMVELLLAALAMWAWAGLAPGLARDAAFDVMLIGAGSTLLFNGNPLLRFDGYHVLADAIEIPNLATRSNRYLLYLGQRWLLGLRDVRSPVTAPGERPWLIAYGIASALYRIVVLLSIALYVAGKMFFIGVMLALWVLAAQVLLPLRRLFAFLLGSARLRHHRTRGAAVAAGAAASLAGALLLPVGAATHADGVVRPPPGSTVRAGADGVVREVLVTDGESVAAGEPLLVLEDPLLPAEVERLRWRVEEIERRHARASLVDRVRGQLVAGELERARAEFEEARERLDHLVVRSPVDGTVSIDPPRNLPGRFVRRGDRLALVTAPRGAVAHVVVPQSSAALVRGNTREVAVRLASLPGVTLPARLVREVPSATDRLPSAALGSRGGGRINVDARDESGLRALERVFQFELSLPGSALAYRPGTRVHVRFRHDAAPLAQQWYRELRQLFLARFQV
jgi:putative peptide zinc metalloprotease protein